MMRNIVMTVAFGIAGLAHAEDEKAAASTKPVATKPASTTAKANTKAVDEKPGDAKEKKVRYTKSKQVDFSNQTVEGKMHRPEASLVTASEGVTDNGLLRLREDFLDKFSTFAGEEIQQ